MGGQAIFILILYYFIFFDSITVTLKLLQFKKKLITNAKSRKTKTLYSYIILISIVADFLKLLIVGVYYYRIYTWLNWIFPAFNILLFFHAYLNRIHNDETI